MLIIYIDGKDHKLGPRKQQELFNQSCKVQIMSLVIYGLGGGHTHKINNKKLKIQKGSLD